MPMPNDTRELPASNDAMVRFLGGSPLAVAFRLILLSVLVGVVCVFELPLMADTADALAVFSPTHDRTVGNRVRPFS